MSLMLRKPTTLTDEQRQLVDAEVLTVIRTSPTFLRGGDVVERVAFKLEKRLPRHPDGFYRFVDQSLQRLRRESRIICVAGRWKTTSPTS